MFRSLFLTLLFCGCASTFDRVKATKTLDEATAALRGDTPSTVNQHPPTGLAWYFGWQDCVLFIDGKLRGSKSVRQQGVPFAERATVDCAPETFDFEKPAP